LSSPPPLAPPRSPFWLTASQPGMLCSRAPNLP
jgi:hypothetical protein